MMTNYQVVSSSPWPSKWSALHPHLHFPATFGIGAQFLFLRNRNSSSASATPLTYCLPRSLTFLLSYLCCHFEKTLEHQSLFIVSLHMNLLSLVALNAFSHTCVSQVDR